jgi:hypothetical protein
LDLTITGQVQRRQNRLSVRFELYDPANVVHRDPVAAAPARAHQLWERTCFECFLAPEGSPGYWEINLSPAGHWNVYRFDDYRQGMREEAAFKALPMTLTAQAQRLILDCELNVDAIIERRQLVRIALSAVVRTDSETIYYALAHPVLRPDFHRREAFLIAL